MHFTRLPALAAGLAFLSATAPAAADIRVVATIAPVHSLVAGVMAGVGQPDLLVPPAASPHTFSMRPSDARRLSNAAIVVRIGGGFDAFLDKPLRNLAGANVIDLVELPGMTLRSGHAHDDHDDHDEDEHHDDEHRHADGDHHDEDEHHDKDEHHAEKDHHDEDHHESAEHHDNDDDHHEDEEHHDGDEVHAAEGHDHHDSEIDGHIWLSTANAAIIADAVADRLATLDPANASAYRANAERLAGRLDTLTHEIEDQLKPVHNQSYVVFHDAYGYFEDQFGLPHPPALTISPEQQPGARRLREVRETITSAGARCLFVEPQFPRTIADSVVDGLPIRIGQLDPLGASLEPGGELYFALIRQLASNLTSCLTAS